MRRVATREAVVDGQVVEVTLIEDPTIDDVVIAEARTYAVGLIQGNLDSERRVERSMREIVLLFGVQR